MSQRIKRKYSRLLNIFIKLLVIVLFGWLVWRNIIRKESMADLRDTFVTYWAGPGRWWLLATLGLMPLNWFFEVMKWRTLEEQVEHLNWGQYFKAILTGITFSLFTPNRIGEYGGRILFVHPENQARTIIATLVGSYAQLLVLLSFGYLGLVYAVNHYWPMAPTLFRGIYSVVLLMIVAMSFSYYNVKFVVRVARRFPIPNWLRGFTKHIKVLKSFTPDVLSKALFFGTLRYLIYTLQYFCMLRFFGIQAPLILMFSGIATVYLLQTSIPLDPVTGLLARGELAMVVWGFLGADEWRVLGATFGLWIINLLIPALFGLVLVLNLNIVKRLGYEGGD